MKKVYNYIMVMMLVTFTALSLTSCQDDDVDQAYDMNGIWQGTIEGMYYHDRYGRDGRWDTEIQFVQDGDFSRGGYGEEVDYSYDTHRIYSSQFYWEVRNGRILLEYDDGYSVIIRDYELYPVGSGMRFRGFFDDYKTGEPMASFSLVKVSDWTDWTRSNVGLSSSEDNDDGR
ncbi:hypothetical protein [Xylanibacter rodentium]|uniref:Lipocalin-like domain-containing protein n=1 Tax=Xylanibacter rodentium TaxID=2736289 RepID=A0ABX2AUV8_9BACT|nr:hypothetical protein [Xylanibacter rodentium]NPE11094.1 hypothetical protein [Prevotella sp. PJ1A]NPE13243.1 hypothetical protein [Xylanibacter rodentium]NPE39011.1 hypothetical protein [Prevotella sp. PCJ2]